MQNIRYILELILALAFFWLVGFILDPERSRGDVVDKYPSDDSIDHYKPYRGEDDDLKCYPADCDCEAQEYIFKIDGTI